MLSQHGFAELDVAAADEVVRLPAELDGLPFPGEALGCAMNIFARSEVRTGDTVAIVGAGFLGLLLVQLCAGAGARTLVLSRRRTGLELARRLGAETPVDPPEEQCDVAIETGGKQETLDLASRLPRIRGRLVLAGFHQDGLRTVDLQSWNWRGLDVINAHEREPAFYREGVRAAVRAVIDGQLDPAPLYTHVLPLAEIGDAFRLATERPEGFVKALVTVG
jgi:threonine dehydrogenase-like Zn-dependent dehydrogenase